ncbi:aspartic proteinase CDR1-like [Canna indica]|uniref:Aspartic proteinase CDR1-like n=1 Tax=Canna indica TaxID=4628 RepID=A0AAQ3KWM1_9LILI|nr:aspartic proteinase CDR1-like [Canna indica]
METGGKVAMKNIGCNSQSGGTFSNRIAGLVGLGTGSTSLVSQLGSTFKQKLSYCLVPLGSTANTVTMPMIIDQTFYVLSLQDISVGRRRSTWARRCLRWPVMTTSSSTQGRRSPSSTTALSDQVSLPQASDPSGELFPACYDTNGSSNTDASFLDITFKFDGTAMTLKPLHAFIEASDGVFLAMSSSSGQGIQILGNVAQQNFQVGQQSMTWKMGMGFGIGVLRCFPIGRLLRHHRRVLTWVTVLHIYMNGKEAR